LNELIALPIFLVAAQVLLGVRVCCRFLRTALGQSVLASSKPDADRVCVLLPVFNEADRLTQCLQSLIDQPEEIAEILVIDGGSTDGTQSLVRDFSVRDPRVRLIDASPVPDSWIGKAWGLYFGLENSNPGCQWILCVDADVHVAKVLTRSLLAHARRTRVAVFSIAARQRVSDKGDALFHPAMLTTLVYRYGIPGKATRNPAWVQANGQCFFARRDTLLATQAFRATQASFCDDVTAARHMAAHGIPVGFYKSAGLVHTSMYSTWRETWRNWPRSLPMKDRYSGWWEALALLEILLIQALPLSLFVALLSLGMGMGSKMVEINGFLVLIRLGVLVGTYHSYDRPPWTYWLSPAVDLPVVTKIFASAFRRTQTWRGRCYIREKGNRFRLLRETK